MKFSIVLPCIFPVLLELSMTQTLCTLKIPLEIKERTAKQNMRLEQHFSKLRNHEVIKKIEQ